MGTIATTEAPAAIGPYVQGNIVGKVLLKLRSLLKSHSGRPRGVSQVDGLPNESGWQIVLRYHSVL